MRKIYSALFILVMIFISSIITVNADMGYDKNNIDAYVGVKIINTDYLYQKSASESYYPYKKRLDKNGNLQCVGLAYARLEEKIGVSPDFASGDGAKDIPMNAPDGAKRTSYITGKTYTIKVYTNDNGENIRSNSWVSFGAGSRSYGHVIYVEEIIGDNIYYTESGTNWWKNGQAGILKKKSKYDFLNKCDSGGSYVGTVAFIEQTSGNSNSNSQETKKKAASTLSIDLTDYPQSIKSGSNYGLRGSITSNYNIKKVTGQIKQGSKIIQSSTDTPNSTSMNIRSSHLNNDLIFNRLSAGEYTLYIEAVDGSGTKRNVSKSFTVTSPKSAQKKSASSTLSINLEKYPVSLNVGSAYGLRGSVTSNYNISVVKGYVRDSSGKTVLSSTDKPNSTNMDIRTAHLNNDLVFNKLAAGNYTMIVEATDTSGRVVTARKDFSVKAKTANTGSGAGGNAVIGIVNIPSSWDNLSIRSGPGTSYQIVGSMNQGAKCTVYPNKASNGWYYVEYNGIKGYASGSQINLQ